MIQRIVLALATWAPPHGFRISRVKVEEVPGYGDYIIKVSVRRHDDHAIAGLESTAECKLQADKLRDMLPEPEKGIHKLITALFHGFR